jgi:hypothetical protein
VLAANADAEVLPRYDEELDAAFEQAREHGDLTPLLGRLFKDDSELRRPVRPN